MSAIVKNAVPGTAAVRRALVCGAVCLLTAAAWGEPARGQPDPDLRPILSCVKMVGIAPGRTTDQNDGVELEGAFGYHNFTQSTIEEPIGAGNFFSPNVLDRGQPTSFLPGSHPFAFRTSFVVSGTSQQFTWSLRGEPVTFNRSSLPECGLFWAGSWRQTGLPYSLFDVVIHDGSTWVAVDPPGTSEPGSGPAWQELASGEPGPQGEPGPPGPPGDQTTFPSSQTRSFSKHGRQFVRDAHVTRRSVVTIQYVGNGGRRPTSVTAQKAGSFVAIGSANRRFRYVVYNQP
jgi:hypothetical protein